MGNGANSERFEHSERSDSGEKVTSVGSSDGGEEDPSLLSGKRFISSQRAQRSQAKQNPISMGETKSAHLRVNVHSTFTSEGDVPAFVEEAERAARAKAEELGLVARWSREFEFISFHDPTTGEWYDVAIKDAPRLGKARMFQAQRASQVQRHNPATDASG